MYIFCQHHVYWCDVFAGFLFINTQWEEKYNAHLSFFNILYDNGRPVPILSICCPPCGYTST